MTCRCSTRASLNAPSSPIFYKRTLHSPLHSKLKFETGSNLWPIHSQFMPPLTPVSRTKFTAKHSAYLRNHIHKQTVVSLSLFRARANRPKVKSNLHSTPVPSNFWYHHRVYPFAHAKSAHKLPQTGSNYGSENSCTPQRRA